MFGLVGLVFVRGVRPDAMLLILSVSLLLRMLLVFSGGQYYWPDEEGRYDNARAIVEARTSGQFGDAFRRLDDADPLFRIIATVPAAIEFAAGQDARIPAMFFAVWSALNIWLLGRIARRLGASQVEALLAAGLLALSSSFLYYARHLMPYDVAMTFGLLALPLGVRSSPSFPSTRKRLPKAASTRGGGCRGSTCGTRSTCCSRYGSSQSAGALLGYRSRSCDGP